VRVIILYCLVAWSKEITILVQHSSTTLAAVHSRVALVGQSSTTIGESYFGDRPLALDLIARSLVISPTPLNLSF
jgi:hypothetical protein